MAIAPSAAPERLARNGSRRRNPINPSRMAHPRHRQRGVYKVVIERTYALRSFGDVFITPQRGHRGVTNLHRLVRNRDLERWGRLNRTREEVRNHRRKRDETEHHRGDTEWRCASLPPCQIRHHI